MTFTITSKNFDDAFISWLLRIIRFEIIKSLDDKRLISFNEKVESEELFESKSNKKFDVRKAIILSLNDLSFRKVKDTYIIEISGDKIFPNYNVKVKTICNLLNYGNISIPGFPIYSNAFQHVKSNLKRYYEMYLME